MGITSKPDTEQPRIELGWKGKGILASICGILIIAVFFALQHTDGTANAEHPNDVAGTCTIEYIESATLPATGNVELDGDTAESESASGVTPEDGAGQAMSSENSANPQPQDMAENSSGNDQDKAEVSGNGTQTSGSVTPKQVGNSATVKHVYKITMPDNTKIIAYGTRNGYIPKDGQYEFSGTARSDNGYNITVNTAYDASDASDVHAQSTEDFAKNGSGKTQMLDEFIWTPAKGYDTNQNETPSGVGGNDVSSEETTPLANDDAQDAPKPQADQKTYPLDVNAVALDKVNGTHEGCAADGNVVISVDFKYKNLFANCNCFLKGELVDQLNGVPIVGSDGKPITIEVPFDTKSAYQPTDQDAEAKVTIDNFLNAARLICDDYDKIPPASAPEGSYQGNVPNFAQVEEIVNEAKTEGVQALEESHVLNEFYSYYNSLTDEQKQPYGAVPTSPDLISAIGVAYTQAMEEKHASGEVSFDVNAPASSVYAKKVLVKLGVFFEGNEIANLSSQNEDGMCVTYPGISTEATVYGEHIAAATKNIVIVDAVSYVGLVPGVQYHLETLLVEKETQSPVVDATNGKTIKMLTEFVPQSSSGIVNVILDAFDASSLVGRDAVVFEKLARCVEIAEDDEEAEVAANAANRDAAGSKHSTQKGQTVAVHQDVNDQYQTLSFSKDQWEAGEIEQGGTLSNMGETPKPFIFGGLIIAALIGIGVIKMRRRMM